MKKMLCNAKNNGFITCEIKKELLDLNERKKIGTKVEDVSEEDRLKKFLICDEDKKRMDRVKTQAKLGVKMKKQYNQSVSMKIGDIVLVRVPKKSRYPTNH